ncbi:MAG: hypothetical protein ACHP9T_15630 [Caulobacterales bacterium]
MPNRDDTRGFSGPAAGGGDSDRREREAQGGQGRSREGRAFDDAGFRADQARLNADLNRYDRQRGRPVRVQYGHDQNYRPGYHEGGSRFGFFGLGQEYGMEAEHRGGRNAGGDPRHGSPGERQGRATWTAGGGAPYGDLQMDGRNRGVEQYGAPADYAFHPEAGPEGAYDCDPDYLHWREQQMKRHDRDYADWRRHQQEQYDSEYRRFRDERRDDFHERFQDWRAQRDAAAKAADEAPNPDDKL